MNTGDILKNAFLMCVIFKLYSNQLYDFTGFKCFDSCGHI